ncbi:MAG: GIY-YIG nuclease family protein [Elainellaceae cyanobacterium]
MDPSKSTPIEHQDVPEAHQGLHSFLYSSNDEHAAETPDASQLAQGTDAPISIDAWCDEAQNAKVAGVYAVLDRDRQPQFIGYSRSVTRSLRGHLTQKGDAVCAFVRVQPFQFPKRDAMEALRDEWIAALPSPPPGNVDGSWAGTIREAATQTMSAAERQAYEEKKLKLRRAMADGSLSQDAVKTQTNSGQDLAAAMNDDNWSAVIREQTQETRRSETGPQ